MIFNHHGLPVGMHQMEHKQIYPQAGWVEHDPMEIWATQDVIKGALKAAKLTPRHRCRRRHQPARDHGLGQEDGQAPITTPSSGKTPAPTSFRKFEGNVGQGRFRDKVGLPLATYFSGPKVRWILDNVPEAKAAAQRGDAVFGNMDTWIIWNLTGGPNGGAHVTDVTNASRTMLMNLKTLNWDTDIAQIMGVPLSMMPKIMPPRPSMAYQGGRPVGGRIPVSGDWATSRRDRRPGQPR
jgi:glycerol kinase